MSCHLLFSEVTTKGSCRMPNKCDLAANFFRCGIFVSNKMHIRMDPLDGKQSRVGYDMPYLLSVILVIEKLI